MSARTALLVFAGTVVVQILVSILAVWLFR